MSITKMPSGKWKVRWWEGDKQRSKSFTRKRDAEEWERQVKLLKETGRLDLLDADLKTLAELAADHMDAIKDDLADKTWTLYVNLWSAHVDARILQRPDRTWHHPIANMTLRQLRPREVEKWKADRLKDGAGPTSINKTMRLMQLNRPGFVGGGGY
jgi:hypothetical protein